MRLGLGTAQFGFNYGITNRRGQVPEPVVTRLLADAWQLGIDVLDCAASYGDAETVLGRNIGPRSFRVVTKTAPSVEGHGQANIDRVADCFKRSLDRLRTDRVYGLLVHDASALLGPYGDMLAGWLVAQQAAGSTEHIGVSVYAPHEARQIFERYPFDLVQAPLNVLDQRMLTSGVLDWLRRRNVGIHLRSMLLQGILIADPERFEGRAAALEPAVRPFWEWLTSRGVSPLRAAVGFVASACPDATLICGVTSPAELTELAAAVQAPWGSVFDFARFAQNDNPLIDPRRW